MLNVELVVWEVGYTSYGIAETFAEPPAYVIRITPYDWRVSESLLSNKAYMLRHFGYRWNIGSKQHTARCLAIRAAGSAHCTYHDEHYGQIRAQMANVASMFDDCVCFSRDPLGPDLADPGGGKIF